MQVGADQSPAGVGKRFERPDRDILGRDGVIDDVIGHNAIFVEDALDASYVAHVLHSGRVSIVGFAPIEFLFGVNHHREDRPGFPR